MSLTAQDIKVGGRYRAKRPRSVPDGGVNDRTVVWMDDSHTRVQYDGPVVNLGRRLPVVTMAKFLAWAGSEVEG